MLRVYFFSFFLIIDRSELAQRAPNGGGPAFMLMEDGNEGYLVSVGFILYTQNLTT